MPRNCGCSSERIAPPEPLIPFSAILTLCSLTQASAGAVASRSQPARSRPAPATSCLRRSASLGRSTDGPILKISAGRRPRSQASATVAIFREHLQASRPARLSLAPSFTCLWRDHSTCHRPLTTRLACQHPSIPRCVHPSQAVPVGGVGLIRVLSRRFDGLPARTLPR